MERRYIDDGCRTHWREKAAGKRLCVVAKQTDDIGFSKLTRMCGPIRKAFQGSVSAITCTLYQQNINVAKTFANAHV